MIVSNPLGEKSDGGGGRPHDAERRIICLPSFHKGPSTGQSEQATLNSVFPQNKEENLFVEKRGRREIYRRFSLPRPPNGTKERDIVDSFLFHQRNSCNSGTWVSSPLLAPALAVFPSPRIIIGNVSNGGIRHTAIKAALKMTIFLGSAPLPLSSPNGL